MLRIALLSPKGPLYRHRAGIFKKSLRYAPLTLPTLAALVPDDVPVELTLIDEGIDRIPEDLDVDLVGLTVITGTAPRAYELAAGYRERGISVVLGGPHVTLVPDDAAPHADSIVVGYAEETWPELLRDAQRGRLRPRYEQSEGFSLAGTPPPRRDLLPKGRYLTTSVFEATRGCVHDCDFCVVPSAWGRKPYQKPVAEVVADVESHVAATGDRRLIFVDLNLIADRPYARALFRALAPLGVQWYGLATTLLADDAELLALAQASGCRGLLIGFESIVAANVARSNKAFNRPESYARVVERLHAHGIAVYGCFVFGMDEDRPEVFEETARFAIEAGIDLPRFAILTPFPGTPLFRRLEAERRLLTRDWELYDGQHVVFEPKRMTASELQAGTERAWKQAYSARSIWSRLRRSPAPLRVALGRQPGLPLLRSPAAPLLQLRLDPPGRGQHGEAGRMIARRNARAPATRLTLIHPCIGRRVGQRYIKTWQMEPLPAATIAGLTPDDVEIRFYDDRMEHIPFDEPTDLVALSVETYTAKRSYQIASEYRRRGVPVVMGGFHASLRPDEVAEYADAVVVGEAEALWPRVVDDVRHGRWEKVYRSEDRPSLAGLRPRREIFRGKRYLSVGLVEAGRGCHFRCDFCAIQTVFSATQTRRPIDDVLEEVRRAASERKLLFFVDDNITSNQAQAKEFFRALIPLKVRWVGQASINAAHDEEFLDLLVRSGCMGVLIGFETLDPENLKAMNKGFNAMGGGYEVALANLAQHKIRLYGTFIFGYDGDTPESFGRAVEFARRHDLYIAAFNHLTPFPGTPLYKKLEASGRLAYERWWLDERYSYNEVPFRPAGLTQQQVREGCVEARRRFYSLPSIARRWVGRANRADGFMFRQYLGINALFRAEVSLRDGYPLGDEAWRGELLPAS